MTSAPFMDDSSRPGRGDWYQFTLRAAKRPPLAMRHRSDGRRQLTAVQRFAVRRIFDDSPHPVALPSVDAPPRGQVVLRPGELKIIRVSGGNGSAERL